MKLKNELIVICLILFILISISTVSAVDENTNVITVNNDDNNILNINDINNEVLTDENDGSFADLNTKINGDTSTDIVLDKNYTYSSTDRINTGILISKNNTVIDGQGHTIDAKGQTRIFNITATTVILKNINFINGNSAGSGGAIYGYGDNLRIFNCTFINNNASWGGAVFSYPYSYAAIVNSTFIGNNANYGGAVFAYNYIIDYYDNFTIHGNRHDIINCIFDSNHANTEGGAIGLLGSLSTEKHIDNDYANIKGCLFTNNEAPEGSAIANILSAYINMTDSVILGNSENLIYSWGSMFFADNNWWGNTVDNMSVRPDITDNVRFTKWLYLDLVLNMDKSTATVSINNLYDSETGETNVYSTTKLPSINAKFETVNATIDVDNADLGHSGKYELNFVLLGDSTITANCCGSTVSKKIKIGGLKELEVLINNADENDVIKLDKDYVYTEGIDNIIGVTISDKNDIVIDGNGHTINGMGKSRLFYILDSENIVLKNLRIVNGFTEDGVDGAGAYVLAYNTKFVNCTFINNTARGYGEGGALHISAHYVSVEDSKFINNTHIDTSGGAIYWRGEYGTITNTLFEGNTAFLRAGAVYLYDGGNIINSTFIHNTANEAGATYNYGTATIDGCNFINNIALTTSIQDYHGAGAVYATNTTITNSLFVNNTAIAGAAVVIASSTTNIDKSIFINNTATSSNGIIFGLVEGGKVSNSVFLNNKVAYNSYTISTIWGKLQADYNWFGNIAKNYDINYDVSNLAIMSKWLFLNATEPVYSDDGRSLTTQFDIFAYDQNTKQVISYDSDNLPDFNLTISTQNLTLNKDSYALDELIEGNLTCHMSIGEDGEVYSYDYKGTITAEYENVKLVIPFSVQHKTWFEANSTFELMKGEIKYLDFTLHPFDGDYLPFLNDKDRITYNINDTTVIKFNKKTGKITALKAGLATITIKFDGKDVMGNDKYTKSNVTILVNVTKAETHIKFNIEPPEQLLIGDSITFSASVVDYNNKSVSYASVNYINNNPEFLRGDYSFKAISEGLAKITAYFEGNENYLPCSSDVFIDVGRMNPQLSVEPDNISIKVSDTYYVEVFSRTLENITYISNDTNVAIMDEDGVHGIGEGVANITIKFGGNSKYRPATAYLIVNVTADKTYVDVNQTRTLLLTDEEYLDACVRDADGKLVGYYLNYTSNDTNVVIVDEYGKMTAVGEGVANITVTFNGRYEYLPSKANVIVTVGTGTSSIDVNSTIDIILNQRTKLNAKLNHDGKLNYSSSNSSVVDVDSYGYIQGKTIGEAVITITYEGSQKYAPCTATVSVKVTPIPTSIDVGKIFAWFIDENDTLNATLNPQKAGKLNFTSNDESIVKVDKNGRITAVGVGKTTIFISFDGNENYLSSNETVEVTVYSTDIPTAIEANKTIDLFVDDNVDIGAVLNPSNAGSLNYTSSDPSVVTVDENGKLTAKKVGKSNITVSFKGNERYLANTTTVLVTVSLIPTSIEANSSITVNMTEKANLDYVFSHPQAGSLKFIFTDYSIASIDNGKIIGDELGKTTLTIKFEGNDKYAASNATVEINVVDVETTIAVEDSLNVNVTEAETIVATLNPKEAGKLRFISNNKDIISVDGKGNVYGIKLGTATVTVIFDGDGKYRSANKTVKVTVRDVETTINAKDSIELNLTESATIVADVTPKSGKLHFNTTDNDIISIDEKGNVKGLKSGNATVLITVDANGKYRSANKTVTVTVCVVETEIQVDNDNVELTYGDEANVNATLVPGEAGKLVFNSSDISIVAVDENGNIKAVKPGEAIITVSYVGEGKYVSSNKTVKVSVKRAPSSIAINNKINVEVGAGYKLRPVSDPSHIPLTYSSSDNETVEIDDNGFFFTTQSGEAVITISFSGNEYYLPSNANVTIEVNSRMTEICVNNTITIGYGDSINLGAYVYLPVFDLKLYDEIKYVSENTDIVSVDENTGLITANAIGKATILLTYDGDKINKPSYATVNVEVTTKTTSITVDETSISLYVDGTHNIVANLISGPEGASLNYISNNINVALVNPLTGEITARGEGKATVTVRYDGDDEYHSSETNISISVLRYKTQIKSENSYELEVYESESLNAVVNPNEGILTYTSSDEDVVSVDSWGNVKTHKAGSAIITIRFNGDYKYLPSQKQVIILVSRISTSINLTDMELFAGEEYNLKNVVVPNGVPTKARYYEYTSDDLEVFDVDNGVITTFHEGTAELYVAFKGNDVYAPSNKTVVVTVVKRVISQDEYKFSVDVDDYQRKATFTLEVPEDAEGMFQVIINGEPYAENIEDGKAVVEIDGLEPGDYKATLRYTGDEKYASINNATTFHLGQYKIDKNNDVDVTLGDYVVYTVHLTRDTQAMEGKKIKFIVNNKVYKAYTDRLGYASVKFKLYAMGTYTIVAKYAGIKVKNNIRVHLIVANNVKAKKTKDLKIQISLKKVNNKYLSGKKVTLKFNGKKYKAYTSKKGVATFTISKSVLKKLKTGKYKYKVIYSTDVVTRKIKLY